jgi:hypothetical protein
MSATIAGNGGVIADVDEARNILVYQTIPGYPTAGGFYRVVGWCTAAIAAALAASTTLMAARFSTGSTRKAYVTKLRIFLAVPTVGAAGGIASMLAVQRFTTATPTGGNARTVARVGPTKGSASDMTDVRDSNAALTVTSVVFGDIVGGTLTPISGVNGAPQEYIFEPDAPIEMSAGDGLCLRTQTVGPATATWVFSYVMEWFER